MLEHGGRLRAAAQRYGIPLAEWLDLSTGIAPYGWPVPELSATVWSRLPEEDDGLEAAAQAYYGCADLLPLAGSQAAIQALPRLRPLGRVGVVSPSYAEHVEAWRRAGHVVVPLARETVAAHVDGLDVLVVVNPNNPTGERFDQAQLRAWHEGLAARGGWLVVDEAFADAEPEHSLAAVCGVEGLVVLRSLGKFFGLAGARVGFVFATPELLNRMQESMGPWTIPGPSREVARQALLDTAWQDAARNRLQAQAGRLQGLLAPLGEVKATSLFATLNSPHAGELHEHLARRAILTRRFDQQPLLRFGLPGNTAEWQRLADALNEWKAA